ncbi:MAG: nuclear transport factor 2 family protein [Solirubrobacterales bacterium]
MAEGVRQKLTFRDRPRRTLDERVAARFPGFGWRLAALVFRLSPKNMIRRRLVAMLVRRGYASLNRGDLDLNAAVLYDDDSELVIHGDLPIGTGPWTGGKAIARAYGEWQDIWAEHRRVPQEVVDLGGRLVVVLDDKGMGAASGVPVNRQFFDLVTLDEGRISRHEVFLDREEGMRAAGLSE